MMKIIYKYISNNEKTVCSFIPYKSLLEPIYLIKINYSKQFPLYAKYRGKFKLDESEIKEKYNDITMIKCDDLVVFSNGIYYFLAKILYNIYYEIEFEMLTYVIRIENSSNKIEKELNKKFTNSSMITHISDSKLNLLCECYDIVNIDNVLYLNIKTSNDKYALEDIASFLSLSNDILCYISNEKFFVKISLNSPGNICIYINEAFEFINSNLLSIILLCTFLFGGGITYGDFKLDIPSLPRLIKSIIEYRYNFRNKKIESDILLEQYKEILCKNEMDDIYKEKERLIDMLKQLCELKNSIGVNRKQTKMYNEIIEEIMKKLDDSL